MGQRLRVAAPIWQGKRWMGGWNYYLNMAKVLRSYSEDIDLILFVPEETDISSRKEAEQASGHPAVILPHTSPLEDGRHLFFGSNRRLGQCFNDANIGLVIEQARFIGRRFPIPVLSWIADLQHREYPEFFSRFQRLKRDVGFHAQLMLREHVYVSSESARSDVFKFVRAPKATVHSLPFTVQPNVSVTVSEINNARNKYNLPENYFIVPNQLWPHKNHLTAIRAMSRSSEGGSNRVLALTGNLDDATYRGLAEEIRSEMSKVEVCANIRWLGKVSYTDLQHLIAGADALVNPSKFEGWSTTVEEAKALGTPMILSDLAVHREQAAGRAEFFPAEDHGALSKLLRGMQYTQDELADRMARAAAQNLRDQKSYADSLERLFRISAVQS